MSFKAWRRVPEAGACPFCLMLATRGAVYKNAKTAGESSKYHHHCRCGVELETDFDRREDIRVSPEDANKKIRFVNQGRAYEYDLNEYRNLGVTKPPAAPRVAQVAKEAEWLEDVRRIPPESIDEAVMKSNPKHATGEEYQRNCTRCVVASEMRIRGYDVTAGPARGDYSQRVFNIAMDTGSESRFFMPPKGGRMKNIGAGDPDGARYWVECQWRRGGGGHIFQAERRNGKTYFFEPQSGKLLGVEGYTGRVKQVAYIRVDDIDLSDDVLSLVEQ